MPLRTRLYDMRLSDLPQVSGLCSSDVSGVASVVNTVQRRLIYCKEAGDEGWNGTWAEIAFNMSQATPYVTLPREIARLEKVTVCNRPVAIQNQFYEYLTFGNGRLPRLCGGTKGGCLDVFARNNTPTFVDLSNPPQLISIYPSGSDDNGKRVLIQGLDNNNNNITSADGTNQVQGQFITLQSPFVTFPFQMNRITGIQKDITVGSIQFFQVDPSTGAQVLLLTMEPGEQTAWYRRYYFNSLPPNCCNGQTTVQVTAMAKLDFIPVRVDTDYCLLQNPEAMIEEAQSVRYSRIDTAEAKQMAAEKHLQAVRLLNGELTHTQGLDDPAVNFLPFGSARLSRQRIGSLM